MLRESKEDAIHNPVLKLGVNVSDSKLCDNFFYSFNDYLSVRFIVIFELINNFLDDFGTSHLASNLNGCLNQLLVVLFIDSISTDPEVAEELRHDLFADILHGDTFTADALLDHFKDNLLHLVIIVLEFLDEHRYHEFRVLSRMVRIHQRNNKPNRLEKSC